MTTKRFEHDYLQPTSNTFVEIPVHAGLDTTNHSSKVSFIKKKLVFFLSLFMKIKSNFIFNFIRYLTK